MNSTKQLCEKKWDEGFHKGYKAGYEVAIQNVRDRLLKEYPKVFVEIFPILDDLEEKVLKRRR